MDNKLEERLMACCPDWATLMLPARGPDDEPAEVQMRNLITEAADEITRLNAENERARNDALAEAANIAEAIDSGRGNEREIAKAIRALITKASRDSGHG